MRRHLLVFAYLSLLCGVAIVVASTSLPAAADERERPQHAGPNHTGSGVCPPVQSSSLATIVYGTVIVNGASAPIGTVVQARSPRGHVVGCFVVQSAGNYGMMYVYGEDNSVSPAIPGMRAGEIIAFRVNGAAATANPALAWANDYLSAPPHQVALAAQGASPTPTRTPTRTPTVTRTPTRTRTAPAPTARVYLPMIVAR